MGQFAVSRWLMLAETPGVAEVTDVLLFFPLSSVPLLIPWLGESRLIFAFESADHKSCQSSGGRVGRSLGAIGLLLEASGETEESRWVRGVRALGLPPSTVLCVYPREV